MHQKLFKHFLPQKARNFRNKVEKEPQKPHPKLKKYLCYVLTDNICSACNPMQVVLLCKNVLIL